MYLYTGNHSSSVYSEGYLIITGQVGVRMLLPELVWCPLVQCTLLLVVGGQVNCRNPAHCTSGLIVAVTKHNYQHYEAKL